MNYQPESNFDKFKQNNSDKQPVKVSAFFPLLFAVMLAAGVLLGYNIQPGTAGGFTGSNNKLSSVIGLIEKEYVDKVDPDELTDKAISGMLNELDPHSIYLSAKDVTQSNEELSGQFGGVGIQFIIHEDTLMVTHLVDKGPAQKKGILPFDRILMVDKKKFFGKGMTNDQVFKSLRGAPGSRVKLRVYRPVSRSTNEIDITRGVIPVPSIDCAVMLTQNIGLIRISQFGENTFADFLIEARKLRSAGMKKMILDLRDNGGGYLQAAENIADQFLRNNVKIVYTKGQNQGRYDYMATSNGEFEDMPLVVLVNHNSASASEIVAGAIQDNDRGAIVGRRTFGKGLVQQQFGAFSDGSALRLTVSRYYTPSGRCIQRPYGKGIDYYHDGVDRYNNQEFYKPDSSKFVDSLKYKTINKKRIVYGGGGIMPDIFVPLDTSYNTMFYANVLDKNCINSFAFNYVEKNRGKFAVEKGPNRFNLEFIIDDAMWNDFKNFTAAKGVTPPSAEEDARSKKWIGVLIKAEVARLIYNSQGYFLVRMINDYEVKKAMAGFWN